MSHWSSQFEAKGNEITSWVLSSNSKDESFVYFQKLLWMLEKPKDTSSQITVSLKTMAEDTHQFCQSISRTNVFNSNSYLLKVARSNTDENSNSNLRAQIDFCCMGNPGTNHIWQLTTIHSRRVPRIYHVKWYQT